MDGDTLHLDITFRVADEVLELKREVEALKKEVDKKEAEKMQFSWYAAKNLVYMDQLKEARKRLEMAGLDTSFIKL